MDKLKPKGHVVRATSKVQVEVADWRYEPSKKQVSLLMNCADTELSDVAFKNFQSRTVRKGNKTKDEGIDLSAHIIIRCVEDQPKATVLVSMGSGVTSFEVQRLLSQFEKTLRKTPNFSSLFEFAHPNGAKDNKGKPMTYRVGYTFECFPYKGKLLDQVLSNGGFLGFDLIAHEYKRFDESGNLQIEQESFTIRAQKPELVTGSFLRKAYKQFLSTEPPYTFDKLRIRYSEAGRERSATLAINELEGAFTKKQVLTLVDPVEGQQTKLCEEIIKGMEKYL